MPKPMEGILAFAIDNSLTGWCIRIHANIDVAWI